MRRLQRKLLATRHPEVEVAAGYDSRVKGTYRRGADVGLTLTGERTSESIRHARSVTDRSLLNIRIPERAAYE